MDYRETNGQATAVSPANPLPVTLPAGALSGSGLATEATLAAASAKLDPATTSASVAQEVGILYDGVTPLTVKRAFGSAASSGDNAIVTAVSGKKIALIYARVTASAAVNVKWRSGTTDISALEYLAQAGAGGIEQCGGLVLRETAVNTALNLNLSAAVAVGYDILYVER